jgi:glycerol kinase
VNSLVMAIDAGTTGVTVLLVDREGNIASRGYREFPQHFPKPGWVEHDPVEIWDAVKEAMAITLKTTSLDQVKAIGITNQRETTVVWDRATLAPVHNAIVWQCRRSTGICDELKAAGLEPEIRSRTGLVCDAYFSGTKLTWLMREVDGLKKRAESDELAFGTIDTWIMTKLSSGTIHATDHSNASRTLLYNIHENRWDERLLEILEVPESLLPELMPSSGRFGETRDSFFDGREIPISGVAGDQQSALFGQACFEEGMSKNTYGTGSFVLTNTGERDQISNAGLLTSVAWQLDGKFDYALEGSIFITGAAVQWLRDGLNIIKESSEIGPLAESVSTTDGVYFVPALVGLGAPHWNPRARGSIVGITRGTTKAHLARAAIEAMAYQTRDVVEAMVADSGLPLAQLRVDGGAAVNDMLCQFQADLLNVAVARPSISETTSMGAAYLAGIAEGIWSGTEDVNAHWKLDRLFEPSMSSDRRESLYEDWRRAVERSLDWATD